MTWPLAPLKPGSAACIVADPPWHFATWSETRQRKAAKRYYPVMKLQDIAALPVGDLAARDCALFLWVIGPMLPHGLHVMDSWGFGFKTVAFCWVKTTPRSPADRPKFHYGLGYWTRSNVELCLLGTRGQPQRLAKDVPQLLVERRREHSRKPEASYKAIERLVPGPRVELFARHRRPGWRAWGNEIK